VSQVLQTCLNDCLNAKYTIGLLDNLASNSLFMVMLAQLTFASEFLYIPWTKVVSFICGAMYTRSLRVVRWFILRQKQTQMSVN